MNNLLKKLKKDDGNSIIILGFGVIFLTLFIGGLLLDFSKSYQMKAAYNEAAQKATQSAIRYQTTDGALRAEAAYEAIRVYEEVARSSVVDKNSPLNHCSSSEGQENGRNVKIKVTFMHQDNKGGRLKNGAHSITMDTNELRKYQVRQKDGGMGGATPEKIIADKNTLSVSEQNNIINQKYNGIKIELVETTPNMLLPKASILTGEKDVIEGKSKFNCQEIGVSAAASQIMEEQAANY